MKECIHLQHNYHNLKNACREAAIYYMNVNLTCNLSQLPSKHYHN
jgi:hypothetical protein